MSNEKFIPSYSHTLFLHFTFKASDTKIMIDTCGVSEYAFFYFFCKYINTVSSSDIKCFINVWLLLNRGKNNNNRFLFFLLLLIGMECESNKMKI